MLRRRRQRLVGLGQPSLLHHPLVGTADVRPRREQQDPAREPVQAVHRRDLRQAEAAAQQHHGRLRHVGAARHRRQEGRLVDGQQPGALVVQQDFRLAGHHDLLGQVPVEVDAAAGTVGRGLRDRGPVAQHDLARPDATPYPVLVARRRGEELHDGAGVLRGAVTGVLRGAPRRQLRHPHARRPQPLPGRERGPGPAACHGSGAVVADRPVGAGPGRPADRQSRVSLR